MARPVSIRDEDIVAAARAVFLERGIQATTADIAARAGISEGSIFKRFKSKVDLFRAAMEDQRWNPEWARDLATQVGKGDVRENLFSLGMRAIAFFRTLMPLMIMSWSSRAPSGTLPTIGGRNPPPVRALKLVTGYFEAEMRQGRMRAMDPEIVARTFLGGLNNFVFFEMMHGETGLPLAAETYVRGLVTLVWSGLEPRAGAG